MLSSVESSTKGGSIPDGGSISTKYLLSNYAECHYSFVQVEKDRLLNGCFGRIVSEVIRGSLTP